MASVLASCENKVEKDSRQEIHSLSHFLSEHCQCLLEHLSGAELNATDAVGGTASAFRSFLDTVFR